MRKLIILFSLLTVTFTSCNSDDDGGSQDPLIGSWRYLTSFEDGVEVPLDDCESQDTVNVSSNGTISSTRYDDFGSGCEVDFTVSGTWSNLGDGTYSITIDGVTFIEVITFEGNTYYTEEVDGGIMFRDVYVRQ